MNIDIPNNSHISGLRTLWKEAFGDGDEFLDIFFKTAFSTKRCQCVTDGDSVVGGLYWFDCECYGLPIAYIYAVATLESYRGKGVCTALMKNTHSHLKSLGYKGAILVPGEKSLFDFYCKMGYKTCTYVSNFLVTASDKKIPIKLIDSDKYCALRRKHLPQGGVIQEKENVDFLKEMYDFYAGEGFVLSARKNQDRLLVSEFLGDKKICQDIVFSLGCKTGIFRSDGSEIPFSMWFPLSDNAMVPGYFGLAFD